MKHGICKKSRIDESLFSSLFFQREKESYVKESVLFNAKVPTNISQF